jgi:Protein of unknown function (DUF3761)
VEEPVKAIKIITFTCALTLAAAGHAAATATAPADAPAGANGLCKDGSYSTNVNKRGACRGHKGVKEWWGTTEAKPAKKSGKSAKTEAASEPAATPGAAPMAAPATTAKPASTTAAKAAAPGGGPDKVWVNTESKVYHCPGDRWYGTTKQGEYMGEAEATAKGYRADRGKACK